tara:strand:+ start:141 stop:1001 length:861 start_codon:yes stop_codon:yes gene_type:complete
MVKKFAFVLYKILIFFDLIFKNLTKKSFLIWFNDFIQDDSYRVVKILNKNVNFFVPNQITNWRVDTFFSKEPETLEWVDKFEKKENLIFWDIGANIGLYSIYNSLKNNNSLTIAFEPSTSNLRVLSRNISINHLENNIKIFPLPLSDKENIFQFMNESQFNEGGALNTFGDTFDFEGKHFNPEIKYNTLGTSLNYLIDNKILELPDYIKIDVDGIEHLILSGFKSYLGEKKIKGMLIEINENFKEQFNFVLEIMKKNGFKFSQKKRNEEMFSEGKFKKVYNYFFIR